jgi:hypothetical protein
MWAAQVKNWHELPIALLNRMAILGHFKRFRFFISRRRKYNVEKVALIVEALIRAIKANEKLHYLHLVDYTGVEDPSATWAPHLQKLFQAFEVHKSLRTVVVGNYLPKDPTYAWLSRLLSQNRNITVLDRSGNQISNGTSIDKIYALNRLYNGSAELVKESHASLRLFLVTMALVESALQNYQRTAVLLSQHVDSLYDFIQNNNVDDGESHESLAASEAIELLASSPRRSTECPSKRARTLDQD